MFCSMLAFTQKIGYSTLRKMAIGNIKCRHFFPLNMGYLQVCTCISCMQMNTNDMQYLLLKIYRKKLCDILGKKKRKKDRESGKISGCQSLGQETIERLIDGIHISFRTVILFCMTV